MFPVVTPYIYRSTIHGPAHPFTRGEMPGRGPRRLFFVWTASGAKFLEGDSKFYLTERAVDEVCKPSLKLDLSRMSAVGHY